MATNKKAVFAGGCFWCLEAAFNQLNGVKSVLSGYTGGEKENPTYEQVCTGRTGHAEAVEIVYDPEIISYERLLDMFWKLHDPTSLNRQGADIGTQYRSAIFYTDKYQKERAESQIHKLDESGVYAKKIVTEVVRLKHFYVAEEYHQEYFSKNPDAGYCQFVIKPKLKKLNFDAIS